MSLLSSSLSRPLWGRYLPAAAAILILAVPAGLAAELHPGTVSQDTLQAAGDPGEAGTAEAQEGPVQVAIELEDGGRIVMKVLEEEAPETVERFLTLVKDGFYDGLRFHRVEKFLVQTGKQEHEYPPVPGEMFGQSVTHEPGMVGMARLPNSYDSGTTQFYIMKKHKANFNGEYTLFGEVVEGMEIVNRIKKNKDKIERMYIVE